MVLDLWQVMMQESQWHLFIRQDHWNIGRKVSITLPLRIPIHVTPVTHMHGLVTQFAHFPSTTMDDLFIPAQIFRDSASFCKQPEPVKTIRIT